MSYELIVERRIEAPAEVVFDAFTDPAAQRVWMRDRDDRAPSSRPSATSASAAAG